MSGAALGAMFGGSEERTQLVDSARRFVRERHDYAALRGAFAAGSGFDRRRWREMAELGWLGLGVAQAHGGLGLGAALAAALVEALGSAAIAEPLPGQVALAGYLLDRARPSPARDAALTAWLAGDTIVALAHHEQRDGATFAAPLAARWQRDGDGVVIGGRKCAVLDLAVADRLLVSAGGDEDALFLVEADAPGVAITAGASVDGQSIGDVALNDVRVAANARVELDAVRETIDEALGLLALLAAAESLGAARALCGITQDYLGQREQFGVALIEFQALQHRLVDMHLAVTRLESQVLLAALRAEDDGLAAAAPFIGAAKIQAAAVGRHVGHEAVQLHGGIGMTDELVVGHLVKRLTANELVGGTAAEHLGRA